MNDESCIQLLLEYQSDLKERIARLSMTPIIKPETLTERKYVIDVINAQIIRIDAALGIPNTETYPPNP